MAEPIRFDRSLYTPEAVEAAVAAYAEHAKFELSTSDDAVTVVISGVVENDAAMVANAFCNHVLHETIARVHQANPAGD